MPFDKDGNWIAPGGKWATPFDPNAGKKKIEEPTSILDDLKPRSTDILSLGRGPLATDQLTTKDYNKMGKAQTPTMMGAIEAVNALGRFQTDQGNKKQQPSTSFEAVPVPKAPELPSAPMLNEPKTLDEYYKLSPEDQQKVPKDKLDELVKKKQAAWFDGNPVTKAIKDNVLEPFSNVMDKLLNDNPVGQTIGRAGQQMAQRATGIELPANEQVTTGNETLDKAADIAGLAGYFIDPAAASSGIAGMVDDAAGALGRTSFGKAAKGAADEAIQAVTGSKLGRALTGAEEAVGNGALKAALPAVEKTAIETALRTGVKAAGIGGAADYIKGATTPDLKSRNLAEKVGSSMTAGTGDTIEQIGSAAKWLGYENLGNDLQQYGQKTKAGYEVEQKEFGWKSLLDPEFYAVNVARTVPTSLSLMPLALLGGATASGVGAAVGLGAFGRSILQSLGAAALSTPFEAALEAGGVYEDMRKKGATVEESDKAADKTFWGNVALLGVTNSAEFASAFLPKGILGVLDSTAGRIGVGAASGGFEEGAQGAISSSAKGEGIELNPEEITVGAIMGGGFSFMGSLSESKDALQTVQHKVIQKLDDQTRADMNEALEEAKSLGIPEEEAMAQIMEAIAGDESGQQKIQEAVQELVESTGLSQVTKAAPDLSAALPTDTAKGTLSTGPSDVLTQAKSVIMDSGVASVSTLQKGMGIGYTKAADIIDQLTAEGFLGEYNGRQPREILGTLDAPVSAAVPELSGEIAENAELVPQTPAVRPDLSGIVTGMAESVTGELSSVPAEAPAVSVGDTELLNKAKNAILGSGKAAVSTLQKELGVGYTQAAGILDQLTADGFIGPYNGTGPREIIGAGAETVTPSETPSTSPANELQNTEVVPEVVAEREVQSSLQPSEQAGSPSSVEVGDTVIVRGGKTFTVTGFEGKNMVKVRGTGGGETSIHRKAIETVDRKTNVPAEKSAPAAQETAAPSTQLEPGKWYKDSLGKVGQFTELFGVSDGSKRAFLTGADENMNFAADPENLIETERPENVIRFSEYPKEAQKWIKGNSFEPNGYARRNRVEIKEISGELYYKRSDGTGGKVSDRAYLGFTRDDGSEIETGSSTPAATEAPATTEAPAATTSGAALALNSEKNGVEVRFDKAPDRDTVQKLQKAKFKYHKRGKYWYAKQTNSSMQTAGEVTGDFKPFWEYVQKGQEADAERLRGLDDEMAAHMAQEVENMAERTRGVLETNPNTNPATLPKPEADETSRSKGMARHEVARFLSAPNKGIENFTPTHTYNGRPVEVMDVPELGTMVYRYDTLQRDLPKGKSGGEIKLGDTEGMARLQPISEPISEEASTQLRAEQKYNVMKSRLAAGNWKPKTQLTHLQKMKEFAENNGIEFSERYQALMDKLQEEVNAPAEQTDALNDHHAEMRKLADQARERIKKKYGPGGTNLSSGLPPDLMADLSIIGYTKILDGVAEVKAWTESMMEEAKTLVADSERVRKWLPAVYAMSQQIVESEDAAAFIDEILTDAFGENPTPKTAEPVEATNEIAEVKKETAPKDFEKLYFSVNPNKDELEAVKRAQPKNVLVSFARWKKKNIKTDLLDVIGYRPENIIVDSGAFSFKGKPVGLDIIFEMYAEQSDSFNAAEVAQQVRYDLYNLDRNPDSTLEKAGKEQELTIFHDYIEFLDANRANVDYVMTLDDMTDPQASLFSFEVMQELGYNLVPVFHFGSDLKYLSSYLDYGADYIALGGSAITPDGKRRSPKERIEWAKPIIEKYPDVKFHMLGTNDQYIIDRLPGLYSADGTRWQVAGREGRTGFEERAAGSAEEITKREAAVTKKPSAEKPAGKDELQPTLPEKFTTEDKKTTTGSPKSGDYVTYQGETYFVDEVVNKGSKNEMLILNDADVRKRRSPGTGHNVFTSEISGKVDNPNAGGKTHDQYWRLFNKESFQTDLWREFKNGNFTSLDEWLDQATDAQKTFYEWQQPRIKQIWKDATNGRVVTNGTPVKENLAAVIAKGKESVVVTENGREVKTVFALVGAKDLIVSHDLTFKENPEYPQEVQPRDRERAGMQDQVRRMSGSIRPSLLGDSPKAGDGAPIVGPDLVVESGNGRSMALQLMYENRTDSLNAYRNWLAAHAESFGFTRKQVHQSIHHGARPILVRIRLTELDRVAFAKEANQQSVAAMSATEQAKEDAGKLTGSLLKLFNPGEDADVLTASNRDFVRNFVGQVIAPNERSRYMDKEGRLNQAGVTRIQNAVFAKAYGDLRAVERLAESTDNNVKNITGAMLIAAPRIAQIREGIKEGRLHDLDLSGDISAAMLKLSDLRDSGQTVEDYFNQGDLFGSELAEEAKNILAVFDANKRSRKRITSLLQSYADIVEAAGDPRQASLFGDEAPPTKLETLEAAVRRTENEDGNQIAFWTNEGVNSEEAAETGREEKTSPQESEKITFDHSRTYSLQLKQDKPIQDYDYHELAQEVVDLVLDTYGIRDRMLSGNKNQAIQMFKDAIDGFRAEGRGVKVKGDFLDGPDQQYRLEIQAVHRYLPYKITNFRDLLEQTLHKTVAPEASHLPKIPYDSEVEVVQKDGSLRKAIFKGYPSDILALVQYPGEDTMEKVKPGRVQLEGKPSNLLYDGRTVYFDDANGNEISGMYEGRPPGTSFVLVMGFDGKAYRPKPSQIRLESIKGGVSDAKTNGTNDSGTLEENETADVSTGNAGRNDSETAGVDGGRSDRAGRSDDSGESTANGRSSRTDESHGSDHDNSTRNRQSRIPGSSGRATDFVITNDLDNLGGAKTKFKQNVAAIRLLRKLEQEGSLATAEEKQILARYVGWGGISEAFDERKKGSKEWGKEIAELQSLVQEGIITEAEYKEMRRSTTNAHYTAAPVVNAMYQGLRRLGFTGGRVLEPSMGTGNFFGLMPKDMTKGSQRVGVELDSITGSIAKLLYPKSDVHIKGFQDLKIADGYFDLAIGNVPFGNFGVVDPQYDNAVTSKIHNYFFIKSLDKVRDGGIVMFITSSGTLNTAEAIRKRMAEKADFLGAIRLPGDAFKANAGTEVTTDIIVLQKRPEGQPANHAGDFLGIHAIHVVREDGYEADVANNNYFREHPDMVLGTYTLDRLTGKRLGVQSDGRNISEALEKAFSSLPAGVYQHRVQSPEEFTQKQEQQAETNGWKNVDDGAHYLENGKLMIRRGDTGEAAKLTGKDEERVKGMVPIRDAVRKLVRDMQNPATTDAEIKAQQKTLNAIYDAFVQKHGPLNDARNRKLMASDPVGSGVMLSVEQYEKEGKTVSSKKGPIFSKRTIRPALPKDTVSTAEEALVLSLFETGKLDFEHMEKRTGIPQAQLIEQLDGRIYKDPASESYVMADEYLSGNVRQKLKDAQAAVETNPEYEKNVRVLETVQPRDLETHEIKVRIGNTWIPSSDYEDYINSVLGTTGKVKVTYDKFSSRWTVKENLKRYPLLSSNVRNMREYGVEGKLTMLEIMEASLNLQSAKVSYSEVDANGKKRETTDQERTTQAQNNQAQLQLMFEDWLWSNEERAARLNRHYNDTFNNIKLREYDGSLIYGKEDVHVPIPGLANEIYKLRPHQKDAIWRALQGKNTLFAHVVGAGKTLEIITTAMEMRRLGIANKPTLVTKNSLVDQMYGDIFAAYPGAKVLKLTSEDVPPVTPQKSKKQTKAEHAKRVKQNRLERAAILSKIATGDYDLILMSHELFGRLPVSPELMQQHIQEQVDEVEQAIEAMQAEGADKRSVKKMETTLTNLRNKLQKNLDEDKKDIVIPFEELGIDQLFVDESHMFKNLAFYTKMQNVAGVTARSAKRSDDMYMKTRWLTKSRNGGGVIFATGTPIANTMSEMYTLQKYLQADVLKELGMEHFDAWAAMFGETTTDYEMTASGQFKPRTRFAQFNNVPELLQQFFTFADVKTAEKLNLPTPSIVNRETVTVPLSEGQKAYMKDLVARAENMKNVDPSQDNYLKLTSDGKKMAVDLRLVDSQAKDEPGSKLNTAVKTIAKIYKDKKFSERISKKTGKAIGPHAQIVFLDLGTPKKEKEQKEGIEDDESRVTVKEEDATPEDATFSQLYQDIKDKLIKQGIPEGEIAFIHDAKTPQQKDVLTRKVREGRIRVLLGSSEKMGAGLNVQDKLVALHHIDPTWRPADIEQREGRIIRQGNENDEVTIYSYVTEGSFDAMMWDLLRVKAQFINQMMNGSLDVRSVEDIGDQVMGYAHVASAAMGNTLIKDKMATDKLVQKLNGLKASHDRKIQNARQEKAEIPARIQQEEAKIRRYESDIAARTDTKGDLFQMVLDRKTYDNREAAEKALNKKIESLLPVFTEVSERIRIGEIAGLDIYAQPGDYKNSKTDGLSVLTVELELVGVSGTRYTVKTPSVSGMENTARNLESVITPAQERIKSLQVMDKDFDRILEKTNFDQEQELKDALAKQVEINLGIQALNTAHSNDNSTVNEDNEQPSSKAAEATQTASPARSREDDNDSEEVMERLLDGHRVALEGGFELSYNARSQQIVINGMNISQHRELLSQLQRGGYTNAFKYDGYAFIVTERGLGRLLQRYPVKNAGGAAIGIEERLVEKMRQEKGNNSLGIVPKALQARRKVRKNESPHAFQNEEIEERFSKAKVNKDTLWMKIGQEFATFKRRITREFEDLPKTAEFAPLRFELLRLENQKGVASDRTFRNLLQGITRELNPDQFDLFRRKVMLDDLYQEHLRKNALPWGFDSETLLEEKAIIDESVDADEIVQQAIETRRDVWAEIKKNYFKAMGDINFDVTDRLQREDYFRHQVIEFANQRVDSSGKRQLRTPTSRGFLKGRGGEYAGDINSDYLQAESEVMIQMLYDIERAKAIKLVKDQYNLKDKTKQDAKDHNAAALQDAIEREKKSRKYARKPKPSEEAELELGGDSSSLIFYSPTEDTLKEFAKKQAIAYSQLAKMNVSDMWTGENGEYAVVVRYLTGGKMKVNDLMETMNTDSFDDSGMSGRVFKYFAELAGKSETADEDGNLQKMPAGVIQARTILKVVGQKRALIREVLGKDYRTWRQMIPDGYQTWQPDQGDHFYMAQTLNYEKLAVDLARGALVEMGVTEIEEYLDEVMVRGSRKMEYVIKKEVASTLTNIMKSENNGWFYNLNAKTMQLMKVQMLIGPTRVIKYNLRNITGDLDKTFAANPRALKKVPQAVKELAPIIFKNGVMSSTFAGWFNRGGMQTVLQVQEMGEVNKLKMFMRFYEKEGNAAKRMAQKAWDSYWKTARNVTDFREAILRYANYLEYLEQIKNSKDGKPLNYGASIPSNVDALRTAEDKAFKLSNEAMIDYAAISAQGREWRKTLIPFYSFIEGNMRSTIQVFKNAARDEKLAGAVGRKILGKTVARSPYYAYRVGTVALKVSFLTILLQLWNGLFDDEEDDLPEDVRRQAHIIIGNPFTGNGRDSSGKVRYFNNVGALEEFLSWFGIDDLDMDVKDILNNRRTMEEVVTAMIKNPINKAAQSLSPVGTFLVEQALGKKAYPNVFEPSDLQDRWEHFAALFGVNKEYKALQRYVTDTPGPKHRIRDYFDYGSDPGQAAYYNIIDLKKAYMKRIGKPMGKFSSGGDNPKSDAAYKAKMALRYGDKDALQKYLMEYAAQGGTTQSWNTSLKNMDPLSGLSQEDKAKFLNSLTDADMETYKKAQSFFAKTLLGSEPME